MASYIPQHLLESSFVPTSTTPNDPGELSRMKAFYSERNKAAQAATQWYDRLQLEKETSEANQELAWARFEWEKKWEPEKFYAGLDLQQQGLDLQRDQFSWTKEQQNYQNSMAQDWLSQLMGRGGYGQFGTGSGMMGSDSGDPYTVYGEDYFEPGGEGYSGSFENEDYNFGGIDYYNLSGLNDQTWSEFMGG